MNNDDNFIIIRESEMLSFRQALSCLNIDPSQTLLWPEEIIDVVSNYTPSSPILAGTAVSLNNSLVTHWYLPTGYTKVSQLKILQTNPYLSVISFPNCSSINDTMFQECSVFTELTLGILTTPQSAFYSCPTLKNIILLSCSSVGSSAFQNCSQIISISCPELLYAQSYAFNGLVNCRSMYLPKLSYVCWSVFQSCGVENLELPACTYAGYRAFQQMNNLKTISLPAITIIDAYGLNSCSQLTSVYAPLLESIEEGCFMSDAKLSILYFDNLQYYGKSCFWGVGHSQSVDLYLKQIPKSMPSNTYMISGTDCQNWTVHVSPLIYNSAYTSFYKYKQIGLTIKSDYNY